MPPGPPYSGAAFVDGVSALQPSAGTGIASSSGTIPSQAGTVPSQFCPSGSAFGTIPQFGSSQFGAFPTSPFPFSPFIRAGFQGTPMTPPNTNPATTTDHTPTTRGS